MTTRGTSYRETTDWREDALCRDGGDYWYPASLNTTEGRAQAKEAIMICRRCPVRLACLTDALEVESREPESHRHGIRGGLYASERATLANGGRA